MSRIYNFCAGPAVLPEEALENARDQLLDYKGSGMSILESSHRGREYSEIHEEAIANYRELLGLSDDYETLFIQGGASLQFAMVPMNFLGSGKIADYVRSGAWAVKAVKEAERIGKVNIAADSADDRPAAMPKESDLNLTEKAAYVHITSNETIAGTQWKEFPRTDAPMIADMSSDILSRPIDMSRFGMIYAGAQKNLGPAGAALVVIRKDLAEQAYQDIPTMLKYSAYIEKNSLFNTPPCFTIYMMTLVSRWIKSVGLETLYRRNAEKAAKIYEVIDSSDFYTGTALPEYRSDMNVTFRLPTEELEALFVDEASQADLKGLKGHRSVGGLRASIYNAFPVEGVEALCSFMNEFERRHG